MSVPGVSYDPDLVDAIADRFDLRPPNRDGLHAVVRYLDGDLDSTVPGVLSLATGVGKTYVMAGLVEYLRREGIRNVLVVTPSSVVQAKTVANFRPGQPKYISGSPVAPVVITPDDYDTWKDQSTAPGLPAEDGVSPIQLFILNIHQLIAPSRDEGTTRGTGADAVRRAFRTPRETNGELDEYLRGLDDLVIIADEHHLYSVTAQAFQEGINRLEPAAIIGLTASPSDDDHVIYRYSLRQAIEDRYVKRPVIAFRKGGYGDHEEEQQLRDALALLRIKQGYYNSYRLAHPEALAVDPALYVQCADVAHATQIAELLREPEYLGAPGAVLQVDNEHNDVITNATLDAMDRPGSPVRAVVSVNKLKEGWDARNIAVMVTLRAMGSEILTQQTLGRGLRLPFGKWTEVAHINQLDIIAHESFRTLLNKEEVLQSFGLEDASSHSSPAPAGLPRGQGSGLGSEPIADSDNVLRPGPVATPTPGSTVISNDSVAILEYDADDPVRDAPPPAPAVISVNEQFRGCTFLFPATTMERQASPFNLSHVTEPQLQNAARRVSNSTDTLMRAELIFRGRHLRAASTDDVQVDSIPIGLDEARQSLVQTLAAMRVVEATASNITQIRRRIVPYFLDNVAIGSWTTKRLASAARVLQEVIAAAAEEYTSRLQIETRIHAVELPICDDYPLALGDDVHPLLADGATAADFHRNAHYGPWGRGLFKAASFDAFDTEYKIATLANRSPSVQWWKRLYPGDKATIAYTAVNTYLPDFVIHDQAGWYWIVEGKSQRGRDDQIVQAKRDAAETVVRQLISEPEFSEQQWGYILAYEDDIARADSWDDLVAFTDPVRTRTS